MSDIRREIKDLIASINVTLDAASISDTDNIIETQILDSYGFVDLISQLEVAFDIVIESEEITGSRFNNVDSITRFVTDKKNA